MRVRVCVTGGIACGKSLIGEFVAGLGLPVRDADDICRELMKPGSELCQKVIDAFGAGVRGTGGELNRRALAGMVCDCREHRESLNEIVHPSVRRELRAWLAGLSKSRSSGEGAFSSAGIAVAIIPLVFEAGWENDWNFTVCVAAPERLQLDRLAARGMTDKEALAWISAQMQQAEKMRRSDYVVFNSGSKECANRQIIKIFENILEETERKYGCAK